MKQILFGGGPGNIPNVATCYNRPFYSNSWTTTAARNFTVPVNTYFRKLHVKLNTAPGVGNSYTFTICDGVAGSTNTALAVTISGTDTEASNLVDEVVIAGGNPTQLKCTRTGTPTFPNVAWSVETETVVGDSFITSSNSNGTVVNNATRWLSTFGGAASRVNEAQARILIPIHCTLRSYAIKINNSPGSGSSFDFDIFKNGTIVGSTSLSVADGNITGYLGGLSIDLAPGDFVSVRCVPVNTPTARIVGVGVEYVPDTSGESFLADCIINNVTGTNRWRNFQGSSGQPASTDSNLPAYVVGETDLTLSNYYVSMNTAPGVGKTRTFEILKNGGAGNNSITVADTNTSGNDLVFEDSYNKGDTFLMFWSSTGGPTTTRDIHNSIVMGIGGVTPPTHDEYIIDDSIIITDELLINVGIERTVNDETNITENLEMLSAFGMSRSDTTSISDELQIKTDAIVNNEETTSIIDEMFISLDANRTLDEQINITENLEMLSAFGMSRSDTTSISDELQIKTDALVNNEETTSIIDEMFISLDANRTLDEQTNITENLEMLSAIGMNISDEVVISENLDIQKQANVQDSETTSITDNLNINRGLSLLLSDEITTTDNYDDVIGSGMSMNDTTTVSEQIQQIVDGLQKKEENATISDSLTISATYSILLTETIGVTEGYEDSSTGSESLLLIENISMSDDVIIVSDEIMNLSDTVSISDNVEASTPSSESIECIETISISDLLVFPTKKPTKIIVDVSEININSNIQGKTVQADINGKIITSESNIKEITSTNRISL